ncbi:penicillin-binding protein activator [uncultured Paraglaciecola sp.]|uniref:penicillin-binding protein activator n=1 Tax=uncultured Paraglaciecola sp. TaxID=1765024 RepID=UPI002631349C|nr:penicillin-binding protein activator [uncultured Paraglaciecola sp.]
MSFRVLVVLCITVFCLFSCTSSPSRQAKRVMVESTKNITKIVKNSDYYLAQAKQLNTQVSNNYQRNKYLVQAAEALQSEQQCVKSIKMLQLLLPELLDERLQVYGNLILAECYLLVVEQPFEHLDLILEKLANNDEFQARIAALEAQLHINNKEWLKAATSLLDSDIQEPQKSHAVWQWIQKLDLEELERAVAYEQVLTPWLQLAIIVKRYGLQPELFLQEIVNWQGLHVSHPLASDLPVAIQDTLRLAQIQTQRIAVLLPLTGRLSIQGLAIKDGILAAYFETLSREAVNQPNVQPHPEIRFFDSALKTPQQLNTMVADFDVVLGPLVKQQIIELAAILPKDKILLALNRVQLEAQAFSLDEFKSTDVPRFEGSEIVEAEHYYFSLAPEDEAEQLARYIQSKQLIRPIIFAAENPITQRMAEAFITQWQENANVVAPDLTLFTDSKDMRLRVSEMLDVAQSKERAAQIESLSDVEVISVERNRRDIDAIVLFANPEQTRLLNPIIEASLSPFARKSLSVFASSRSYSLDLNSNSLRDLRNLTFTDMPWMLPDHNWQTLANQTTQLWPQRQDTLLRLFALGFDAYNLLPNLRRLKTLPQMISQGLTGDINIDDKGVVHRRLPWAQVAQDRVKLLELD